MDDKELHLLARQYAEKLIDPDKKQLRFNDIIEVAKLFYNNPEEGILELIQSCDRKNTTLYVKKQPMWESLKTDYKWMLG